jgi:hypothetical protein
MLIYAARKEDKSMNMKEYYDVIIVGTGAAGLYCALNLPERKKVLLLTKQKADQSDSFLAQGGICMLRGEGDYNDYFQDTMRAGHFENDENTSDCYFLFGIYFFNGAKNLCSCMGVLRYKTCPFLV